MSWTKLPLSRQLSASLTETVRQAFAECFRQYGCTDVPAVAISSGFDPTVRLIGSHISVLKPYLKAGSIPSRGLICLQDCVRTRNLRSLGAADFFPEWGSYFQSLGVLVPPSELQAITTRLVEYFSGYLKCRPERLVVRLTAQDTDLLCLCRDLFLPGEIEVDTRPLATYRHSIGEAGLTGRNLDLAIRPSGGGDAQDIGNIIVLSGADGRAIGVELAFGVSAITCRLFDFDHVLDCHPVPALTSKRSIRGVQRQMEDIIVTSSALFREGLRPSNRSTPSRLLKKYLARMPQLLEHIGMEFEALAEIADTYVSLQYPTSKVALGNLIFGPGSFVHELIHSPALAAKESAQEPQ